MTTMAPMSSTIANVNRNTLRDAGALADEREDTDGERDVGRHRDAPASSAGPTGVERDEQQCGHDHAAQGAQDRQHRGAGVAKVAMDELAFDLQAGDEEE